MERQPLPCPLIQDLSELSGEELLDTRVLIKWTISTISFLVSLAALVPNALISSMRRSWVGFRVFNRFATATWKSKKSLWLWLLMRGQWLVDNQRRTHLIILLLVIIILINNHAHDTWLSFSVKLLLWIDLLWKFVFMIYPEYQIRSLPVSWSKSFFLKRAFRLFYLNKIGLLDQKMSFF